MRFLRLALIPLLGLLGGCNYVHFGRLPNGADAPALAQENAELRSEKKILEQEIVLARKESDTLRSAIESGKSGAGDAALATRLGETTRELAALRASYAKLDAERARLTAAPASALVPAADTAEITRNLAATEEKLATALRSYTLLREETSGLRNELQQAKAENSQLTVQVQSLTAQNAEARAALAQLNTELLAQKDARARASQEADAARAQLSTVLAASRTSAPTTLGEARTASATGAATLAPATLNAPNLPPAETPATARLSTSRERLAAADTVADATTAPLPRTHVVAPGETLEKLAKKYYGNPEKWRILYAANNAQLSLGRPLKVGMVLEIPER